MRPVVAAMLVLSACSDPSPPPAHDIADESLPVAPAAPITDLRFKDDRLQAISTNLTREARFRGIEVSSGHNRVERLLSLEASLGGSSLALNRVNALLIEMTARDVSQWARVRQKAERDFSQGDEALPRRVRDLLQRWQRRKSEIVCRYLSSNYNTTYITSLEWERRFHEFVTERPLDAATWGWLVLRDHEAVTRQQYGRADSESAYRFYLEFSGLGDGREARMIFSVPGIEIREAPVGPRSSAPLIGREVR